MFICILVGSKAFAFLSEGSSGAGGEVPIAQLPECMKASTATAGIEDLILNHERQCKTLLEKFTSIAKDERVSLVSAKEVFKQDFLKCKAEHDVLVKSGNTAIDDGKKACSNAIADATQKKAAEELRRQDGIIESSNGLNNIRKGEAELAAAVGDPTVVTATVFTAQTKIETGKAQVDRGERQTEDAIYKSNSISADQGSAETILSFLEQQSKSINKKSLDMDTASDGAQTLLKGLEQGADVGNNKTRQATAPKQEGGLGNSKGQGGAGSPTDQANNNQQKKQDEAGGGGGGMPSMGGGSGSGSSSPLTVNEAKQDCSNPSFAASNPVCTCRLNATDSRCAGILAAEKNSQTAKKAANMYSDDSTGGGGGFSTAGGGYKTPEEKNISQHGQLAQGAGGSVGKGVGSGVGSKEANDPRQAQARSYRDQYTTGKRGGGSYGSGGGGSFAAGQAGQPNSKIPSTFARANVGKNQPQGKLSAADLRAQMQARFAAQRRGPSSTTGRADITGPHTDQFKKIRVRYAELMGL